MNKKIIQRSKYPVAVFKQRIKMQRGRFGHRPRNDPHYYNGIYPFIQTGNVVKASESNEKIEYTQTLNELGLSTSRLFDEKVLVITIAANIGYTAILDYAACFPDSLVALTLKDSDLSLEYLNIYIRLIRQYIENLAPQAAQKNINLKQLGKLPIIVPDKDIQQEIVTIMEEAYAKKNQLENEAQVLLGSIDTYLLQELGLDLPSKEENTLRRRMFLAKSKDMHGNRFDSEYCLHRYKILEYAIKNSTYNVMELSKITEKIFNGTTPNSEDYSEEKTKYSLIKVSSYNKDFIDLDLLAYTKKMSLKKVQQNDIFILAAAHQNSYVGKSVKFLRDTPSENTSFVGEFICVRANSLINPLLLFYILKLDIYKELLNREKRGQTAHIYPKDISKVLIPVPEPERQLEMVKVLERVQQEANELENKALNVVNFAKLEVAKIILGDNL